MNSLKKYSFNGSCVRDALIDGFSFRRGIRLLGTKDQRKSFFVDVAILSSEGKEKYRMEEFLGDLRASDVPDNVPVFYKDPWKTRLGHSSKSVNRIGTEEPYWKFRIYFVDMGSKIHDTLVKEDDDVYYNLLKIKVEKFLEIVDVYYTKDMELVALEQRLKKKYTRK